MMPPEVDRADSGAKPTASSSSHTNNKGSTASFSQHAAFSKSAITKQHANSNTKPDVIVNSPVGGKAAIFKYTPTSSEEIIETIRWVSREYQEFKPAIENLLLQADAATYDDVKDLCDRYNKITGYVNKMNKGTSIALKTSSRASQGLLRHIMHQVYSYAVADPEKLNQYAPFSSEVYGETSFEFVAQMIDDNRTRPSDKDTFIDLGSGVGQVVLQVAASVECKKCYGIEKADVPAEFAQLMEDRFKFWMDWFGKAYTEFEIFHGDFFEDRFSDIIKESTHLFINNFAFKPEIDHKLKLKFIDLKDGTRIISSKQFCPPRNRVTERDLSDIGSIMHVIEIQPEQKKDTVSWTDKQVPYYLHILDGSRVEKYYEKQKERSGKQSEQQEGKRKRSAASPPGIIVSTTSKSNANNNQKKPVKKAADDTASKTKKEASTKSASIIKKEKKIEPVKIKPKKRSRIQSSTDTEILINENPKPQKQVKLLQPTENVQPATTNSTKETTNKGSVKQRRRKSGAVFSSLELLHDKTIESNTMDFSQPAPGCVDHSLSKTVSNASTLPNVIINDLSMFLTSRNIDKLFEGLRQGFDKFVTKLKQPNIRESLLREIQREKDRKRELMFTQGGLTRHIKTLSERANRATSAHCEQLGIMNSNKSMINHLGTMLSKHQELSKQISQLSAFPVLPSRQSASMSPQTGGQHMSNQHHHSIPPTAPPSLHPPAAHSQHKSPSAYIQNKVTTTTQASLPPLVQTVVPVDRRAPHMHQMHQALPQQQQPPPAQQYHHYQPAPSLPSPYPAFYQQHQPAMLAATATAAPSVTLDLSKKGKALS